MTIPKETIDLNTIAHNHKITKARVKKIIALIKKGLEPIAKRIKIIESGTPRFYSVERRGVGIIHTPAGKFWQYNFMVDDQWQHYSVIVKAKVDYRTLNPILTNSPLIVRTDSGCQTGQLFGDLTCECREQLQKALTTISQAPEGIIISIPGQDGRGLGLPFKLATLWLQDALPKINTVQSAALLSPGGVIDVRTYAGVVAILQFMGIDTSFSISLATNNPKKHLVFEENGYNLAASTPICIPPTKHTKRHLLAKQKHLGHKGLVKEKKS